MSAGMSEVCSDRAGHDNGEIDSSLPEGKFSAHSKWLQNAKTEDVLFFYVLYLILMPIDRYIPMFYRSRIVDIPFSLFL